MIISDKNVDEAAATLRLTLPLMSRHAIPTTPANYAVWYQYVEGTNRALQDAIEVHISSGRAFTAADNDSLYRRFVLDLNGENVESLRRSVRTLMDALVEDVATADQGLERYGEQLDKHGKRLLDLSPANELVRLVSDLADQTGAARDTGTSLQTRLREGQKELQSMRLELEKLRSDASTDPLTGLANRRTLMSVLDAALDSATEDAPVSMLFADIDHFKAVNDRHGHLLGDKVIRHVANTMRRAVKGCDTVARYGGEEFVVVLPETPYAGAAALANKLRIAIEGSRLVRSNSREPIGAVTVSLGVAQWRKGDTVEALLDRADICLALAKKHGRNRAIGERDSEYQSAA